jgi:hypothetical protein
VSGVAVRESLTVPALPAQVRAARAFVQEALGPGHPCAGDAVLLVSELVTNSVRHSGSAVAGGRVTVTVMVTAGGWTVLVAVADRAGDGVPVLPPPYLAGLAARRSPRRRAQHPWRNWRSGRGPWRSDSIPVLC